MASRPTCPSTALISPSQDFQIEPADRRPDDPDRMVGLEQIIERRPAHLDLVAYGKPQPRLARWHRLGSLGGRRLIGQVFGS